MRNNKSKEGKYEEHRTYFEELYTQTPFWGALTDERTTTEVGELTALCQFAKRDMILDVGCGQGRHCLKLLANGYHAFGLDYSRTLINIAGSEAAKNKIQVPFVRGNMRSLPFRAAVFDWALSLFGSFGFLSDEDNERTVIEIGRVLKPGGKLLLEIWNKNFALKRDGDETRYELGGDRYLVQKSAFSQKTKRMTVKRLFIDNDKANEISICYRIFTVPEISDLLENRGFQVEDVRGSLSSRKLSPDSRSMVICCRKTL